MHCSMPFCSINSASSVFTMKIQKITFPFKYPDDALNPQKKQKKNKRNVGHFMHSTVAALIMYRRGWGYQTPIMNDKKKSIKFIHYIVR